MTRLISGRRRRPAAQGAARRRAAHRRPGPRGAVQLPRQPARAARAPPCSTSTPAPGALGPGGAVARGRGASCSSSPRPACCPCSRRTSPPSGCPAAGWSPARCPPSSAARRPPAFDLVLADPPYATPDDEVIGVLRRAVRGRLAGPRRRRRGRARQPRASRSSGRHPSPACATGATARPCSGTVAPREACRLPRILRPGHQRARRRHQPGGRALRRARRRGAREPRQGRPVHRSTSAWSCCATPSPTCPTSPSTASRACSSTTAAPTTSR